MMTEYRTQEEIAEGRANDPVLLFENYLIDDRCRNEEISRRNE